MDAVGKLTLTASRGQLPRGPNSLGPRPALDACAAIARRHPAPLDGGRAVKITESMCAGVPAPSSSGAGPYPAWTLQNGGLCNRWRTMTEIAGVFGRNAISNINDCRGFLNRSQTNCDRRQMKFGPTSWPSSTSPCPL
jgi:hypothetical protein